MGVSENSFKYNPCIGSIANMRALQSLIIGFKYNPCIGSIRPSQFGMGGI